MNTQTVTLDVTKRRQVMPEIRIGQGDENGTTLVANIYDNGEPFDLTSYSVRFAMKLPFDMAYWSVGGTVDGNTATFAIDESYAASVAGVTETAYVEVLSGSTVICSTNRIRVVCLESAYENVDPAHLWDNGLEEAIARANAAAEAAEGVVMDDVPTMSATVKGGAKLGAGLQMTNGVLSLAGGDIEGAVDDWLDAHPEATTTVQDNSVTDAKLVQSGGVLEEVHDIRTVSDGMSYSSAGDVARSLFGFMHEIIDSNVLYQADSVSVLETDGTSPTYVYHRVLKVTDFAAGDAFTLTATSVTGAGNYPLAIYVKTADAGNVRTAVNPSNSLSVTLEITESDISGGASYIEFLLYASRGTVLSEPAVYEGVTVCAGVSKRQEVGDVIAQAISDAVGDDVRDDLSHIFTSNILYQDDTVTVSGAGNYVMQTVCTVTDFAAGDYFEFSIGSVSGASTVSPLYIYVDKESIYEHVTTKVGRQSASVTITQEMIDNGAVQVRFLLYPATGTPMETGSATFEGVTVQKGATPFTVGDYMQAMLDSVNQPFISETVKSIAHRGDDVFAPQCVEAAYTTARKHRHTIAENDLFITVDGVYVMWHDTSFARLGTYIFDVNGYFLYTDGTDYYWYDSADDVLYDESYTVSSASVSNLTQCAGASYGVANYGDVIGLPYDVVKNVDAGAYKGFSGQHILTFAEWVLLCKQLGMEIYVDKKISYTTAIINDIFTIVNRLGMKDKTSWIISTLAEADALRALDPNARLLVLNNPTAELISTWSSYNIGRGFAFNGDGKQTTQAQVQLGLDAGFEVEAWYVDVTNVSETNQFARIRELVSYGVTGLTLDHYRVDEAFKYLLEDDE